MQLFYFTKSDHALSNIEHRRIKISELAKLNDPFEWAAPAFKLPGDRLAMAATKRQMGAESGIICFSANWRNPVQWSHYGDRHQGICLGFELNNDFLTKVRYRKKRPEIASLDKMRREGRLTHEWLEEMVCTKFDHWAYEEEYRVFVNIDKKTAKGGLYFKDFDVDMKLTQVTVGHDSTVSRADVDAALGGLKADVKCFKARLAFKTFEVCQQMDATRWK